MAISIRKQFDNQPEGYEAWADQLHQAHSDSAVTAWLTIDALVDGKARFSADLFKEALRIAAINPRTADNLVSLGVTFPVSRRRENLTPAIHDAIRSLEEGMHVAVLAVASKEHWTREDTRTRVKAFKAGDLSALNEGWVKPKPVKRTVVVADGDGPDAENADKPVFDQTGFGSESNLEERAARERGDFAPNDANQEVMNIVRATERLSPSLRMVNVATLSAPSLQAAIATLTRLLEMKTAEQHRHALGGHAKPFVPAQHADANEARAEVAEVAVPEATVGGGHDSPPVIPASAADSAPQSAGGL